MSSTQRPRRTHTVSSKYRVLCEQCGGVGYYLPRWAKSYDSASECDACKGEGEVCQSCGEAVPTTDPPTPHGCVGPADPADVMAIQGYYANLPRYEVDEVWTRNGKTYCQISERFRSADCPPDATIYRYEIVEHRDHEVTRFTEVGWVNGCTGKTTWNDDAEQAYEDNGR